MPEDLIIGNGMAAPSGACWFTALVPTSMRSAIACERVGAGGAGERIVREMFRNRKIIYDPIGFVDDNVQKIGSTIQGVKVLGALPDIPRILKHKNVKAAIITIADISHRQISGLYEMLRQSGITVAPMPR